MLLMKDIRTNEAIGLPMINNSIDMNIIIDAKKK